MQFESFSAFIAMGGYAGYVWSAFAITIGAMVANVVIAKSQFKRIKKSIQNQLEDEE